MRKSQYDCSGDNQVTCWEWNNGRIQQDLTTNEFDLFKFKDLQNDPTKRCAILEGDNISEIRISAKRCNIKESVALICQYCNMGSYNDFLTTLYG